MIILKIFIIWGLFGSPNLKAEEKSCVGGIVPIQNISNLEDVSKHLEWNAASDVEIRRAPCVRKNFVTEEEIRGWLQSHQSERSISQEINGIKFENESPENLRSFEYLTTAFDYFGRKDREKQKIFSSTCTKVECAVKEIFGKDEGLRLLFMQQKYGLNGSHLVKENSSSWNKEELDHLLLALTDYPEGILPFSNNRPLVHFKRGYTRRGGDSTVANSVMEIFDLWNEQSPEQKRYTITHELGHGIAGVTNVDDSQKWKQLSGWEETSKVVDGKVYKERHANDSRSIISKYGETNQFEDFAESVSAYRYNPKILREANPNKYNLIKEVIFDNVEYTSEDACRNPKRLSAEYKERMQKIINEWEPTTEELLSASKICTESVIIKLSNQSSVNLKDPEFQKCYEDAINQSAKDKAMNLLESHPNKEFIKPMFRNIKLDSMPADKLKRIVASTEDIHRKNLKNDFNTSLIKDFHFVGNQSGEKLNYVYQSFDKKMGFDPFTRRLEISNIAKNLSKQINETHSLRRKLRLDFSESEISEQIDLMIK